MKSAMHPQDERPKEEGHEDTASEAAAENPVRYLCMKYNRHQEGEEIACRDPDLYCKFRSSCLIHYQEKHRRRKRNRSAAE